VSLGRPPERLGHLQFVPGGLKRDNRIFGPATEPSPAVFGRRWAHASLWAPRRAMRRPDIHSVYIRPVFVPICKRSRIVRVGLQEGWYPPNTEIHLSRTRVPGVLGGQLTVASSGQYNVLEYTLLRYLIPPMQSCLSLCAAWNVVSLHT